MKNKAFCKIFIRWEIFRSTDFLKMPFEILFIRIRLQFCFFYGIINKKVGNARSITDCLHICSPIVVFLLYPNNVNGEVDFAQIPIVKKADP